MAEYLAFAYLAFAVAMCFYVPYHVYTTGKRDKAALAILTQGDAKLYVMRLHGNSVYGTRAIQQGPRHVIRAAYKEARAIYPKVKITIRDKRTGRFVSAANI